MSSNNGLPIEYNKRTPDSTKLYKLIQENINTFYAERNQENRPVPAFIQSEFEAFLKCGIYAHGFVRVHCEHCSHDSVVAFSCKKRGICISCASRRMSEIAIHLMDNVIPKVPTRQYVLSLPYPLRLGVAYNRELLAKICNLANKEISKFIISKSKVDKNKALAGTILFLQRFGSSLNLNPHFHIIALDGVYEKKSTGRYKFYSISAPTDEDIGLLVKRIADRINKYLVKIGHLYECEGEYMLENSSDIFAQSDNEIHLPAMAASIAHTIAFGENSGKPVKRLKDSYSNQYWPSNTDPEFKGDQCAASGGYSLHANTALKSHQRERLEKLISYMARPCISEERIEILENEKVRIKLKTKWSDNTTHIELTSNEFIEKLVALIPPSFFHMQRYYGILSSHSKDRGYIVPQNTNDEALNETQDAENIVSKTKPNPVPKRKYIPWADLLKRVFKIDILECPNCQSRMKVVGMYTHGAEMIAILESLGIKTHPPHASPPKYRGIFSDIEYSYS